jgi:hypothetical protein
MSMAHRERVALRKLGNPEGWAWFSWQCVGEDAVILKGCVPTRAYTKGPRKGRSVYDPPYREVVVTDAEVLAERKRFEDETGKCGECSGAGREFARWTAAHGTEWRPCRLCNGSCELVAAEIGQ